MATISEAGQRQVTRSGGKIVRPRRGILPKTPYDRPRLLNSTQPNPNWIYRHIFSPTRTIVTGASRMLSSVLGFDASSSSSSSSDSGSTSDGSDNNNDDQDVSSHGVHTEYKEPQSFAGKNETKHLIEQLLMQETFSREECDKLANIIKSRVVDSPTIKGMRLGRLNEMPNRTVGSDVEIHDLCNVAVMEARKFLDEKKPGSNSKSELHHGTSALNSVTLTHGAEDEAGSPVDMAKSYMQTRPPWASPSMSNIKFRSTTPIGMSLFKEETPYSIGDKSLYSSKRKRDSPATGSWNIQEEIRKVRSKATEEMLRTLSSSKIDWSSFALEHKSDSLVGNYLGPAKEDNLRGLKNSVDASADLAAKPDVTLDQGQRLRSTVDMNIASHSDIGAADVDHLKNPNGSIQPFSSTREATVQDSQVEDKNCLTSKEVAGIGGAASTTANGFPSLGSRMSAELDKEQNHRAINEEDKAVGSGHDNTYRVAAEEKCELLSEASVEVPIVNETDGVASDSHLSSSMHCEGSPQQKNTPNSKRRLAGKSNSGVNKKQQGKKVSRYNTRGKGGDS